MPPIPDNVIPISAPRHPRRVNAAMVRRWAAAGDPRSELDVLVTPDIARALLELNRPGDTNRLLSQAHIETIKRLVTGGDWINTGEPVIVSDTQVLNDGQYRLTAIAETGHAAVMDLRFGVTRSAFAATNSGRKRTSGDVIGILGLPNRYAVAAVTRCVAAYFEGMPRAYHRVFGNREVIEALERWPGIPEAAHLAARQPQPFRSGMVGAIAFLAGQTTNQHVVEDFIDQVTTGQGRSNDPARQWRDMIIQHPYGIGSRANRAKVMAWGIIAWNNFRRNDRSRIRWSSDQKFPVMAELAPD